MLWEILASSGKAVEESYKDMDILKIKYNFSPSEQQSFYTPEEVYRLDPSFVRISTECYWQVSIVLQGTWRETHLQERRNLSANEIPWRRQWESVVNKKIIGCEIYMNINIYLSFFCLKNYFNHHRVTWVARSSAFSEKERWKQASLFCWVTKAIFIYYLKKKGK